MLLTISIPTSLIVLVAAVILIIALLYFKEKNKGKRNKQAVKEEVTADFNPFDSPIGAKMFSPSPVSDVRPDSAHSNEDKLEAFLSKRGYPKIVSSHDMLNSGVNMNALGYLNGNIGKYRFTRDSFVGDWTITKTETE